jgi:hypothetical protein
MPDVTARRVVYCPSDKASHYLAAFVADHQDGDGVVRVALVRQRKNPASSAGCTILVTMFALQSSSDRDCAYSITWLRQEDGSREFAGTLAVENCGRNDRFDLILAGNYTTVDSSGARVDCTRGGRTGRVSPSALLRTIADYVKSACASNEAALAGHSRYLGRSRNPSSQAAYNE